MVNCIIMELHYKGDTVMNRLFSDTIKIERINKRNSDIHISRILKEYVKENYDFTSIRNILQENDEIARIVDRYYFPQNVKELANRKFEYKPTKDMSLRYLMEWGTWLIEYYWETINKYISRKRQYENALFEEKYNEAYKILGNIQKEFGISEWLLSQKFIICGLCGEGERDIANFWDDFDTDNVLKIVFIYYEKMANLHINYEEYTQNVSQILEKFSDTSFWGRYLNYKININKCKNIHELKSALIIDEQVSLVDYYETFIDVLQNLYNKLRIMPIIKEAVNKLQSVIMDYRIRNIYIAFGGKVKMDQIEKHFNTVVEEYTIGNYSKIKEEFEAIKNAGEIDFDLNNVFLKANINIAEFDVPHKDIWRDIFLIYNLNYKLSEMVNRIGGYFKLFYTSSWKYKFCGILVRKLNNLEYEEILSLCVINDRYLSPLFYQAIISENDKIDYLDMFKDIAYNTICLHKYVIIGKKEISNIDSIRFQYYTILRKSKEEKYIECIELCKLFLSSISDNVNKIYYEERIRRTLFLCYVKKEFWSEAMHLYVESFLLLEELVIRMSLEILVKGIRKCEDFDNSIRYDICRVIIFRLYYKGNDREVISAYLDYLEGQGFGTVIEYIKEKKKLDNYEIFFLFKVCTESLLMRDYVSISQIKGNATNIRIRVLKTLLKKDLKNSKVYFNELNSLYKEIQLQERMESFNHNRIFIDKIKLIDYLNETINKEFSEYANIMEIKKLYNMEIKGHEHGDLDTENTYQFFYDIVEKVKQAYLFDSPYSLEYFLSARIRHVFCKDSLKRVFEEQTLFAKKLKDESDEYIINEYWHDKLKKDDYRKVIQLLSEFSKNIDLKIQEIRDVWIRIRKNYDGNEMFDYRDFTEKFLDSIELDYSKVLDSERHFYISVINELDKWTNGILEKIRKRIEDELKPYYRNKLYDLEAEVQRADITQKCKRELLRKIEITKAKYIDDINRFEEVFYMKSEQYPEFSLKDVVEFCCMIEKDINSKFDLVNLTIEDKCHEVYNGKIFPYMVDIVSVLVHNAVEHSQFQDMSLLQINITIKEICKEDFIEWNKDDRIQNFSIILNVNNNLADCVNEEVQNKRVRNIIESMEESNFNEKSKLVKGSGLYKIARTLYYNLDGIGAFHIKYENGWFNISVAMDLREYIIKGG